MHEDTTRPDWAPTPAPAMPARLGRYRVLAEIARGGAGVVCRAEDTSTGRVVALKVLTASDREVQRRRFEREARLAGRLDHPGIIDVHEVGSATGDDGVLRHYIAMPLIDGPTLAEQLPALRAAERLAVFEGIVDAVAHAHSAGVIHRDLKPSNVLVTAGGRPIVTDFGLARDLSTDSRLTHTGQVMGTAHYMAPEQVLGQTERVGPPTDVWALGVLLYELRADARPFGGGSLAALQHAILHAEPPPLPAEDPADRALARIARKALDKAPQRRYPDAGALAAELARWRAGQTLAASRSGWLRRVAGQAREGGWRLALGALLIGLAVTVGGALWARRAGRRGRLVRAREAARREDWSRVLALADDGPASAALSALAAQARRALAAADEQARALAAAAGRREGERALAPYAAQIQATRALFYQPGADVRAGLDALVSRLEQLARLSERPEHRASARLWALLGIGWYLAGWSDRSETALQAAARLAPDDPRVAYYLGRLYLERALITMLTGSGHESPRAQVQRWCHRAAAELARADGSWRAGSDLEKHLAQTFLSWARGDARAAHAACVEGLERFGDAPGVESYWLLRGWLSRGAERLDAWQRGLARRPYHPLLLYARGTAELRSGQLEAAERDLRRAAALDPRLAPARTNLGVLAYTQGDKAAACRHWDRALALDPDDVVARSNRGLTRVETGDLVGARADLERLVRDHPQYPSGFVNLATLRRAQGDTPAALAALERASAIAPELALAHANRAGLLAELGRLPEALTAARRALSLAPDDIQARYHHALTLHKLGRRADAAAELAWVLERAPRHTGALTTRGLQHAEAGRRARALADFERVLSIDPRSWPGYLNRASVREEMGDLAGARADLTRALKLRPRSYETLNNRGLLSQRLGKPQAALDDFARAITLAPARSEARVNRGDLLVALGRVEAGLADYAAAIAAAPKRLDLVRRRGTVLLELGRLGEAIADYQRVLRDRPEDGHALSNLAAALTMAGQPARALPLYDRALRLEPRQVEVLANRGEAHRQLGHAQQAYADFSRALQLDPRSDSARYRRAELLRSARKFAAARADYDRLLADHPRYHEGWASRGMLSAEEGALPKAQADLSRAIQLAPRHASHYHHRGLVWLRGEAFDRAEADFRAALRIAPRMWQTWLILGVLELQRSRPAAARAAWDKARQLAPPAARALVEDTIGRARARYGK